MKFSDENAFDVGGVTRDMFSAFYEAAYMRLFDGPALLTPVDFRNFSSSPLPTFGTIVSHAYLVAGILPVKIAFPSLCGMLLQNANSIPDEVLIQSFVDSLNCHEASIVRKAASVVREGTMASFPGDVQSGLLNVYSRLDVRQSWETSYS